jgi:hypothetical protein
VNNLPESNIREVTDRVSYWKDTGHYFFYWCGDEFLLKATNDEDAIKESYRLQFDLESC